VTYFSFATHPYPKMNLVPRYDFKSYRPEKKKFTDGRTNGQHHTIIHPVKDRCIKRNRQTNSLIIFLIYEIQVCTE